MRKSYRRRKYFINRRFQGRAVFRGVSLVVVGGLAVLLIFSFLSSDTMTMRYGGAKFRLERTPSALLPEIAVAFGIYALVLGALVMLVMIFFSHRIIGPLHRIKKHIRSMAEGDMTEMIRLRKNDDADMKELAENLNALARELSGRLSLIQSLVEEITLLSEGVEPKSGKHPANEAGRRIKSIVSAAKKLSVEAGYFKTKKEGQH